MSVRNVTRVLRAIRLIKKSGKLAKNANKNKKIIPISKKILDNNLFDALVKERKVFLAKKSGVSVKSNLNKLFKR